MAGVEAEATEVAVGLVNRLRARYEVGSLAYDPWQRLGRTFSEEMIILPHVVTVVETFARVSVLNATELQVPPGPAVLPDLWKQGRRNVERNWDGIRGGWLKWHGIDLTQCPDWPRIEGSIEARNAIMHGRGRLSSMQLKDRSGTTRRLSQADVELDGDHLVISGRAITMLGAAAVGFVRWLDGEAADLSLAID